MLEKKEVYQFKITLRDINPPIWRRIQVPAEYSLWDLHVAIQDSMGWLDCHLHVFHFDRPSGKGKIEVGIPDEDGFEDDEPILPGWKHSILEFFKPGMAVEYRYDFGDGWEHDILFEGVFPREKGKRYPKCLDGARACPPEDCGGTGGYEHLLSVISNPDDPEFEEMTEWLGVKYEPEQFSPNKVHFDNPKERWKLAFEDWQMLDLNED